LRPTAKLTNSGARSAAGTSWWTALPTRSDKSRHPRFSVELGKVATLRQQIREGVLGGVEFPDTSRNEHGTITKPAGW
jgi:hypothetical protein